ncbi:MAG: Smr/MutS family protein [Bacteroidota bacterium]
MIFPSNFEKKLGFDTIRNILTAACQSEAGRNYVDAISFSSDFDEISLKLRKTEEFRQILMLESGFPRQGHADLRPQLHHLKIPGTYLEPSSLQDFKASINTIIETVGFFKKPAARKYPHLLQLAEEVILDPSIVKGINAIIDDKGRVRDEASPRLAEIRRDLNIRRIDIDHKIYKIFKQAKKSGWTEEGLEPTIRGGRIVIPIVATHKRKIRGFIHDESATGHTVFLEPEDIFDTNNEIRELELAEHREIVKILLALADELRPYISELLLGCEFLGIMDFIRAKASFALSTESLLPHLNAHAEIFWKQARHPLLLLNHKSQKKSVVPLDIRLDPEERILIISGPNAGGKSVCLKTVGLLQYMLQCGLLVPMMPDSELGIFEHILLDIGDEQSLENDLSTYSSHLLHMSQFLKMADDKTIFLIDEFGSGTEPQSGGAIAESILEVLNMKKAMGVVTTHYANLKLLASKGSGIVNGAMLFDQVNMEPLFRLEIGKPGSSFAFEIARKTGLPDSILKKAEDKVGRKQLDFDRQLQELETEKKDLRQKLESFRVGDQVLTATLEKYQSLNQELESARKEILERAKSQARQILETSNKAIENTIKEIRESQAEKEKTKHIRQELENLKTTLIAQAELADTAPILPPKSVKMKINIQSTPPNPSQSGRAGSQDPMAALPNPPQLGRASLPQNPSRQPLPVTRHTEPEIPDTPEPGPMQSGSRVKMAGQSVIGRIESMKGKEAMVAFGSMIMKCTLEKLEKASLREIAEADKSKGKELYNDYLKDINQRAANFPFTFDMRGKRAEEGLTELKKYLDEAILLGVFEIRVLHGKGDGILRQIVRQYLQSVKEIKSYRDEQLELGGHGITVINLR